MARWYNGGCTTAFRLSEDKISFLFGYWLKYRLLYLCLSKRCRCLVFRRLSLIRFSLSLPLSPPILLQWEGADEKIVSTYARLQ